MTLPENTAVDSLNASAGKGGFAHEQANARLLELAEMIIAPINIKIIMVFVFGMCLMFLLEITDKL